jgi:hypothetical protein
MRGGHNCGLLVFIQHFVARPGEVHLYFQVLVDLAGSERTALTGATGVLLHQSIGINKSLFVLRKVIAALAQQSAGQSQAAAASAPARPG